LQRCEEPVEEYSAATSKREPMKAKFYKDELWKNELEQVVIPMLEKYEVVVVDDPAELIRW
jgi:hypothetical protein